MSKTKAQQIAEVIEKNFGVDLSGKRKGRDANPKPMLVSKECPTGLTGCDQAEMKRMGQTCPIPEIAGQNYYIIRQSDGRVCVKPSAKHAMQALGPGHTPSDHLNAIAGKFMEQPEVLAKLLAGLTTGSVTTVDAASSSRSATESLTAFSNEKPDAGIKYPDFDPSTRALGSDDKPLKTGIPSNSFTEFLKKPENKRLQELYGKGVEPSAISQDDAFALAYLIAKFPGKYDKYTTAVNNALEHLEGGSRSERRSSSRRSDSRSEGREVGLTAHLEDVRKDLFDPNTIAVFRSSECPVEYEGQKWVKSRGNYAECERRMGFRWVSPSGWCYPEGLCAIKSDDIVESSQKIQETALLYSTLAQAWNKYKAGERDAAIAKNQRELWKADNAGSTASPDSAALAAYRERATEMLPSDLQMLPDRVVMLKTDQLLEKSLGTVQGEERISEDVRRSTKSAFIQAYMDQITSAGGSTKSTPANDDNVEKFITDSMFCAKVNSVHEVKTLEDATKIAATTVDSKKVDDHCKWVPVKDGGFFLTTLAAKRSEKPGASATAAEREVYRRFVAGQDPLALAFRTISDEYMKKVEQTNRAVSAYMSPKRA